MATGDSPGIRRERTLSGSRFPCAWSADGSRIVGKNADNGISAWDSYTGKQIWSIILKFNIPDEPGVIAVSEDRVALLIHKHIYLYNLENGKLIKRIPLPSGFDPEDRWEQGNISWSPDGDYLSVVGNGRIYIFSSTTLTHLRTLEYTGANERENHRHVLVRSAWHPTDNSIAAASYNAEMWNPLGEYSGYLEFGEGLYDVAWPPRNSATYLAGAAVNRSVIIWDTQTRNVLNVLEGHTDEVRRVEFSHDGAFLISSSGKEARIWSADGWKPLGRFGIRSADYIALSPVDMLIATQSARGNIQILSIDSETLLNAAEDSQSVTYTSAKIVLVGDSGVGKTGLGWRLAHGSFKEHSSTHGQQFWILSELTTSREDGALCEAILWDLAGQPDYRLIHALFLDDADLALLVCDPTHPEGPVQGVRFWINQLNLPDRSADRNRNLVASLIAARCDRGAPQVSHEELLEFARSSGLKEVFYTSALTGEGLGELTEWLKSAINWNSKPATVTTSSFKKIKDYVLSLKERVSLENKSIYSPGEIGAMLKSLDDDEIDSADDLDTALLHLSNHGYVAILRGSSGDQRILLIPELLNNLAASVVIEARRNSRGLGSLDESLLLSGGYHFSEIQDLAQPDRDTMLDSVVSMLIQHNVCFREVDPLNKSSYIVFPELINSRKPLSSESDVIEEDASYTISGSIENVYASLVVLLGYTNTFTRTAQWRSHARYEVGDGLVCGFRMAEDRGGEQDFVLYYGEGVGSQVRNIFKGLFESFLSRHDIIIHRFDPVLCVNGHRLNRVILREFSAKSIGVAHCPMCAASISIPDTLTPTRLSEPEALVAKKQERVADLRGKFEESLFKIKSLASDTGRASPSVFISYAWGDMDHERWVERRLSRDLLSAGVNVILDRWESGTIGDSITRFVERIVTCDKIVVVGTPAYKMKYENSSEHGHVVAAEGDLLATRILGSEKAKSTVLPILVSGDAEESFPNILKGRVYGRFDNVARYETNFIDLAASIYGFSPKHQVIVELKEAFAQGF